MSGISRRRLLRSAAATLVLSGLQSACGEREEHASGEAPRTAPPAAVPSRAYSSWGDLYRERWRWDRIAKGTHHGNCWYQRCCNWNVFVKDGLVWREEQAATYPQTNANVPDFNPRGCQKGACFSQRMMDSARVLHPLRRAGARGEGRWKRTSWSEALDEIADRMIDVLARDGAGAVYWDEGSGGSNIGVQRTHALLDTPVLDLDSEFGDHHPGAAVTCGKISFCSSGDDLFYSDLILVWGGNPSYTQIPNIHFANEARYHGARVVAITPDYSASAIHADQWIPVAVGSDAALGLSLAHVLLEEGLYDARFVAEQTDLALLVRMDTRTFLRGADLSGADLAETRGRAGPGRAPADLDAESFLVWDEVTGSLAAAPRDSLRLGSLRPALEGVHRVECARSDVELRSAFSLLRERLAAYAPEATAATTGVAPAVVRRLARAIASASAATCLTQSNFGKFYHGLEMERAQFLVFALAGQFGRKGSGVNAFPNLWLSGHEGLIVGSGRLPPRLSLLEAGLPAALDVLEMKWHGMTPDRVLYALMQRRHLQGGQPSSTLFLDAWGGLGDRLRGAHKWDARLTREGGSYLDEAYARGWQVEPKHAPRIFFEVGGNYLRRNRGYPQLLKTLWPRLDLVVCVDWRMSFTALHSDFVLPAAGYYEDDSIPWTTPIAPFAHVTTAAVAPLGEAKSDWDFHCLLARALERRARVRDVLEFSDRSGQMRRLDDFYERFTFGGRFPEGGSRALMREALELADNLEGVDWEQLEREGFARYTGLGSGYMNMGNATDVHPDQTLTANTWHTERKALWPTRTGRMQFYIDHPLYRELDEVLPAHFDPPPIGGEYPLQLTSGHTRWSVHAAWRDQIELLRLQRGEPWLMLSVGDATARGLRDGDAVRVFNDEGAFELRAKISGCVRPGQVIVYHAFEPYQFARHHSQQVLTPNPINPIQLAGGWGHLRPRLAVGTPGPSDRATRVDVERSTARRVRPPG